MKNTSPGKPPENLSVPSIDFEKVINRFLLQQPQLFESFMENSPAQAWISDGECRMYYMNRAYRQTFNLGDESLMKPPGIFPEEYLRLYIENNKKVIRENQPLNTIEDGYDQLGRYRIFKVCKFPLGIYEGKSLVGGCMVDLTAELKAEKELRQTNERHSYALKAISDAVWEWNVVKKTMFMSEGYEALFGYKSTDDINALQLHVHPEDVSAVVSSFLSAVRGKEQSWETQHRYVCKDGSVKHVLNKAFIVRGEGGSPQRVIGALQDMTGIKHLQEKLITEQEERKREVVKAVMEAQEKERNEIGKELHDNVNQLLATTKLLIESVRLCPEKGDDFLKQSIELLNKALEENRNLSHRLIAPSLEPQDFCVSVRSFAATLNLTRHIAVIVELPSLWELKNISGELRLSIYRIIQEQLGNIVKHAKAKNVLLSLCKKNKNWELKIRDDGVGFNTNRKRKGVGLKNIRSRVEIYNGSFSITSSEGKGCCLFITIPKVT
jgi:PAS domain S-box-containing protein